MISGLYVSAAIIGLASSPHCFTMCGALCEKSAHMCASSHQARDDLSGATFLYYVPVLLGRLVSYAVAGALLSLMATHALGFLASISWMKPIWIFFQVGIVILGFWMLIAGSFPASLSHLTARIFRRSHAGQGRSSAPSNAYIASVYSALTGCLWAFLPCGVLHSVLLMSALANSPMEGAVVMLIFGLTSSISLVAGGWVWSYLMQRKTNALNGSDDIHRWSNGALSYRFAGLAVVVAGAWSVYRMLIAGAAVSGAQCG